jgi:hypothetical protein
VLRRLREASQDRRVEQDHGAEQVGAAHRGHEGEEAAERVPDAHHRGASGAGNGGLQFLDQVRPAVGHREARVVAARRQVADVEIRSEQGEQLAIAGPGKPVGMREVHGGVVRAQGTPPGCGLAQD